MKHIFYILTIMPIIWKLYVIQHTKKINEMVKDLKKKKKNKEPIPNSYSTLGVLMFGYLIWDIFGLLSFQWPLFLAILISSFIPKTVIFLRWIDAAVTLTILVFILLNAYHFHIDIFALIKK